MDPGNYIFTITDALDSSSVYNYNIVQPAPLELELYSFDATCNGTYDGVAIVEDVDGGTAANGNYQYYWNVDPTISQEMVGFLTTGTYTVTVVDDNGCTVSGSVEVAPQFVVFPNPSITDISCAGSADGVIDLYPVSPYPPFSFNWSSNVPTGNNLSSAWQLGPGFYTVTITDGTGVCSATASYTIEEPLPIAVDYSLKAPRCYGDKGSVHILGVENALEPWKATIVGQGDFVEAAEFEVQPGMPQRLVIEDAKGCKISEDFLVPDKQEMFIELGDNHSIKYGENVDFDAQLFPLQNVTFEWSPAEGLSCTDCPYPVAAPTDNITYQLRMTDPEGCEMKDFVSVFVRKSRDIFIPNAFSPNRDGVNDKFIPYAGFEVKAIKNLQVFDRWGGLIYSSPQSFLPGDTSFGWDGSARGKDLPTGAYLYTMNVEFIDGETVLYSGDVMLMR
jgi:gliding motility-associated-like protein